MPDRWEYRTLWTKGTFRRSLRDAEGNDYGPFSLQNADEFLNRLGQDGWEICSLAGFEWGEVCILLKRRIATA